MRELTKEEIERFRKHSFTFGALKKFMMDNNIPDDTLVMVERVEDVYYEGGCDISGIRGCPDTPDGIFPEGSRASEWGVYLVKDITYLSASHYNECIDNPEKYPEMVGKTKIPDEELKTYMNQFHPSQACSYIEEDNILLIHVHY